MARHDYFRRKAQELLDLARATRDPRGACSLRSLAVSYERLAETGAQDPELFLPPARPSA
jgi:hypothetical protein